MTTQGGPFCAPEANGGVSTGGGEELTVGVESDGFDWPGVTLQGARCGIERGGVHPDASRIGDDQHPAIERPSDLGNPAASGLGNGRKLGGVRFRDLLLHHLYNVPLCTSD